MADGAVERMERVHLSTEEEEDEIVISEEKECLRKTWSMKEEMLRIVEVGENLFYFRFTMEEWMNKVLSRGPWNFDNHILLLQQWREVGSKIGELLRVDGRMEGSEYGRFMRV
ncbi:hypothetical protein Vadar_026743 [Vaccinium darrowii]|uniref:Uncharacterized protein n=1 Tax=Vaccinium darrowii TaxID=229202 RepID=A0ACB7ZM15_9ERIC|nr:hypothetical protein Vadar_026743 [Vaccinium darrowii]